MCRYLLFIVGSLFFSCSSDPVHDKNIYTLIRVDSASFESLSTVNVNAYCVKYHNVGNQEYLFWGNRPQNSIEIFNLRTGLHFKTIKLPREGPNSISDINGGFSVISMDSIFISNSQLGRIHMFDTNGILLKTFDHTDTSYYSANNLIGLNTKFYSDIYKYNNNLIFPFFTPQFPIKPSDDIVYDLQVVKLYSINNGIFMNSGLHFEPQVYDPLSLLVANSNTMLNGRYYYQIATQSKIRFTDDFLIKKIKEAKSRYHTDYVKMNDYPEDILTYNAKEFSYRSLLADPFRQVIYRTVKLPVEDILKSDLSKEFEDVYERVSIMILDKELNVLGEVLFHNSNYSWNECFVGKKGLYLLRSSYHPLYYEPQITYDIFTLHPM